MEDDELAPDQLSPDEKAFGHGHSQSASNMQEPERPNTPRTGITWGPNFTEDGVSMPQRPRRRSISQDNMSFGLRKKVDDPDGPVELMATFSFRSAEGVGLKSRRLSTTLPAEFHVDSCELNEKFSSSSHVPFFRGKTVGKGATAVVKLMHRKGDASRTLYAVKEYRIKDKGEDEEEYIKKVQSEYTIAHSLNHPNIVQSIALCTHHKRWNNVMEYCQFGELYHWVEKGLFRNHFKLTDRNCFFKQLLRGVDYLHSHGIAHRDIKLENLLLTGDGFLKITDFGVSDVFCGEHPGLRTAQGKCGQNMVGPIRLCAPGICGSLPYIAPEVLTKHSQYDPRALDVWSCAIVYITMTYGGGPWNEAHADKDTRYKAYKEGWTEWLKKNENGQVTDENMPKLPGMFGTQSTYNLTAMSSPPMRRLMIKMLHPDPDKRLTIAEVMQTNVIKNAECCTPDSFDDDCCTKITSSSSSKDLKKNIMKRHNHVPPKEHKTPLFLQHRFDMGDGWR
jgi:protein-serine/threonine kinase